MARTKIGPPLYGFPPSLLEHVDAITGLGPSSACGFCGDTILGQRHRIIDAITERFITGDDAETVAADYGLPVDAVAVAVAASYEHDKASVRERRAERRDGKVE